MKKKQNDHQYIRRVAEEVVGRKIPAAPPLNEWEQIDLELRQAAQQIKEKFIHFTRLASRVLEEKIYQRAGYLEPDDYFNERVGIAYRTVARYVQVYRATRRLPEEEMEEAMASLAEIGIHKAAALAPAIEREPDKWREWVEEARNSKTEAIQATVSEALGLKPRGAPANEPGAKFARFLFNQLPPDEGERARKIFSLIAKATNVSNPVAVFCWILRVVELHLAQEHGLSVDDA